MGLLRLILAATIVLWHGGTIGGYQYMDPKVSIHTFYIISGFYMSFILHEKYSGNGSYGLFLGNRLLRIYPVYGAVLLLTLITYPLLRSMNADTLLDPIIGHVGFAEIVANLTIVASPSYFVMNARDPVPLIVPPAWTLGLELLFYTIAPYLTRLRVRYLVFLTVGSILLRKLLLYPRFVSGAFVPNRFILAEICFFLMGMTSYVLLSGAANRQLSRLQRPFTAALFVATLVYQYAVAFIHAASAIEWGYYLLVTVAVPFVFWYTRRNRTDRLFGELSYPVYLSNMLIIWLLKPWFGGRFGDLSSAVFLCATIAVSWTLVMIIDRPVNRFRQARVGSRS